MELSNLIKFYERYKNNISRNVNIQNLKECKEIINITSFLDSYYSFVSFPQRMWHIKNCNFSIQNCEICKKPKKWNKNRYNHVCCNDCAIKYEQTISVKKMKSSCKEKFGVDNYKKTEEYIEFNNLKVERKLKLKLEKYSLTKSINYRYLKNLGNREHLIYCPICNNNFILSTCNSRFLLNRNICTNCHPKNNSVSFLEEEIFSYIISKYPNKKIIRNDRNLLSGKELDFYIPDLNIAIEINGDIWHANPRLYKSGDYIKASSSYSDDIWKKDKIKNEMCNKLSIKLYTIWEYDWKNNRKITEKKLKTILEQLD